MLIRVIYVSTAVGPQTSDVTNSILRKAQVWNKANHIAVDELLESGTVIESPES
ncbi:MAG: hypothetical protein PSV24_15470 [Rhodoferax sp.]|nr:hypothetical protein [Rhodoferax sp.]